LIWFDRRHSSTDRSIRSIEEQYSTEHYETMDGSMCVRWLVGFTYKKIYSFFYWNEMKWLCFRFVASCCFVLIWLQCCSSGLFFLFSLCFIEPKEKKQVVNFDVVRESSFGFWKKMAELFFTASRVLRRYYGTGLCFIVIKKPSHPSNCTYSRATDLFYYCTMVMVLNESFPIVVFVVW
jgi:hypothetical protein